MVLILAGPFVLRVAGGVPPLVKINLEVGNITSAPKAPGRSPHWIKVKNRKSPATHRAF